MSERRRLPNCRSCESFSFELNGLRFTASIGRFDDGRIAEVFLNNHKAGNQSDTNARDAAILLSFALQYGADINEIRKALCRDSRDRALGPVAAALDLISEMKHDFRFTAILPGICTEVFRSALHGTQLFSESW